MLWSSSDPWRLPLLPSSISVPEVNNYPVAFSQLSLAIGLRSPWNQQQLQRVHVPHYVLILQKLSFHFLKVNKFHFWGFYPFQVQKCLFSRDLIFNEPLHGINYDSWSKTQIQNKYLFLVYSLTLRPYLVITRASLTPILSGVCLGLCLCSQESRAQTMIISLSGRSFPRDVTNPSCSHCFVLNSSHHWSRAVLHRA